MQKATGTRNNESSAPASLAILLVEDSVDLCKVWQEALTLLGHHVVCYFRGEDALEDTESLKSVDILISDYYLPDINGLDLFAKARVHRPDLPAILLTGARESILLEDIRNTPNTRLLFKPLELHELEACVESLRPWGRTDGVSAPTHAEIAPYFPG